MAAFTPGPWTVVVERVAHTNLTITYVTAADPVASKESGYLSVPFHVGYAGGADSPEREAANARLVSRAPCLFDVLSRLVGAMGPPDAEFFPDTQTSEFLDLVDEAKRLLAEAA